MKDIKKFIDSVDLDTVVDGTEPRLDDESHFRNHMVRGYKKLLSLKDKYKGRKGLVMGHGPTVLDIKKKDYNSHVKITCNDFHKIEGFFEHFKPDVWCAANSYEALKDPFTICIEQDIDVVVSVPRKREFLELLSIAEKKNKMELVHPWQWEHRIFQHMLAEKYGIQQTYSRCNTVTNHMIALALWVGCSDIDVTGFDLSYKKALEITGRTHAGHNGLISSLDAFDDPQQRSQIMRDLGYLCLLAKSQNIHVNNLSHKVNGLPKLLS